MNVHVSCLHLMMWGFKDNKSVLVLSIWFGGVNIEKVCFAFFYDNTDLKIVPKMYNSRDLVFSVCLVDHSAWHHQLSDSSLWPFHNKTSTQLPESLSPSLPCLLEKYGPWPRSSPMHLKVKWCSNSEISVLYFIKNKVSLVFYLIDKMPSV